MRGKKAKKLKKQARTETVGKTEIETEVRYKELKKEAKQKPSQFVHPVISRRQQRLQTSN